MYNNPMQPQPSQYRPPHNPNNLNNLNHQPSNRQSAPYIVAIVILFILVFITFLMATAALVTVADKDSDKFDENGLLKIDYPISSFDSLLTETSIDNVVKKASDSVVSITVAGIDQPEGGPYSSGTGVIISKDGYIITNQHVTENYRQIQVTTNDGTVYSKVQYKGRDPLNDLAFLKIEGAYNLPVADLGDSGSVRVGQSVLAIGNSLGQYQNTVTSGIVSGLGRPVAISKDEAQTDVEYLSDLIQTDAAINPGNSGGPLMNVQGQVIGINTAASIDGQSIGFAIPINAAKGLIKGMINTGKIQKVYLGVRFQEVRGGALVKSSQKQYPAIDKGGPADLAGIKEGDIITKVNGKKIGEQGGLGSLISEYLPNDTVTMTINRNGVTKDVIVVLGIIKI